MSGSARGVRRTLDFDTLPVETSRNVRRRLNTPESIPMVSGSPLETGISGFPAEILTKIMGNMDQQTLGAMRRQSTRMADIGRPMQKLSCMNQLMTRVRNRELHRELHRSLEQTPEVLGSIIKRLAVRIKPKADAEEDNVWIDTTFGYLQFVAQDDLENLEDDLVNVRVKTQDNPVYADVRGAPGSPWNATCIVGFDESVYWRAFVMQTVHCHLEGRFEINPFLAQSVFVIESMPDYDFTMYLGNGHDFDNYPLSDFVEENVSDLQALKWIYCSISLGVLLFNELGFLDETFFENLNYILLENPIEMFGIKTDIVPLKDRITGGNVYLYKSGLGPRPESTDANEALWRFAGLRNFFDDYLPRTIGINRRLPVEELVAENTKFPKVKEALLHFYQSRLGTAIPIVSGPNFLDYLKNMIESLT